jgi:predicted TPR repeat methyltransferase
MTHCIACSSTDVEPFLDLGRTALANKFLLPSEIVADEPYYPLVVGFCHNCAHVQLVDRVPPAAMFEDYLYISSLSSTLVNHLDSLATVVVERFNLGANDLVVDIGSNDGTLLESFRRRGVRTLGVDPAKNLTALAAAKGIETLAEFFDARSASNIAATYGRASVITATNVFLHIPELGGFMQGLETALAPGGTFVAEWHYLGDLLEQRAFDTVYHEHCSYWSLTAVDRMLRSHGFAVYDLARLPIHHGQLRIFAGRIDEHEPSAAVAALKSAERDAGMTDIATYRAFAADVRAIKDDLRATLADLQAAGKRVVGYGAPAKGSTLLSYLELGPDRIEYIADKSPLKQGRVTPGSHIPIVPAERLIEDVPDYTLLLAWNFADEILKEQDAYRKRGGKFILPVPTTRIL